MVALMVGGTNLAADLRQRVTMFHAGDEKYSGEWLTKFQRTEGAWQVCMEILGAGVPNGSCDMELLQEFCAQTLARLSRAFIRYHPEDTRQQARDVLEALLVLHAESPACIARQLALALVCADLWLGSWSATKMLCISGLPEKMQLELLILPTQLLFCDRALPLNDRNLQQAAAKALYDGCEAVFPALLTSSVAALRAVQPSSKSGVSGSCLECLGSWLRAVRKSLGLLPGCDEAAPLRVLAGRLSELLMAAAAEPAEACYVATQISRWKCSPSDLAPLLQPLLEQCFLAADTPQYKALIPLFSELASSCWPRAAMGEMNLDWQAIAACSLKLQSLPDADDEDDSTWVDTEEGILGVWQTFADSILEATNQSEGRSTSSRLRGDVAAPPPEKRKRVGEEVWRLSRDQLSKASSLQQLFGLLIGHIMSSLQLSERFRYFDDQLAEAIHLRAVAQSVVNSWIALTSSTPSWQEALDMPFLHMRELLRRCCTQSWEVSDASGSIDEVWHELEVVLWLASSMLESWPEHAREAIPYVALILELEACDKAPQEFKALFWASAARLAATAPAANLPQMLAWVLQRPPAPAAWECGMTDMLKFTETPYAEAIETICRRLAERNFGDLEQSSRQEVGERLFALAFATYSSRPCGSADEVELAEKTLEAQALLLEAMRHIMGSERSLLCDSLGTKVLPRLAKAAEAEALRAQHSKNQSWRDTLLLYATLKTVLPSEPSLEEKHPAAILWGQCWHGLEQGLLHWPQNSSDQPSTAAAEALVAAVHMLPNLLTNVLQLVANMTTSSQLELKMRTLREIIVGMPCPPCDPAVCAGVLALAVAQATASVSLSYQRNIGLGVDQLTSPTECEEAFRLLAEAIRPASEDVVGAGPCQDLLRPRLLAEGCVIARGLEIANEALPGCTSTRCAEAILLFLCHALDGDVEAHTEQHRQALLTALGQTCGAICRALSLQEHMADPTIVSLVAEILAKSARSFPEELPAALQQGLCEVQVPDQSRAQFWQHFANRPCWAQQQEWQEHLQQIVCDWQRHQHVICT